MTSCNLLFLFSRDQFVVVRTLYLIIARNSCHIDHQVYTSAEVANTGDRVREIEIGDKRELCSLLA